MKLFDYVIVGGGSAGAVMASRLSENPSARVLLLEAGLDWRTADAPAALRRPELWSELMLGTGNQGWHWPKTEARRTLSQPFRPYRQGLGLGGSSIINGMVSLRPPLSDFDEWEAHGCVGWSGKEVLRSFVSLEDDAMFGHEPYHGVGGPIPIYRPNRDEWGALDVAFVDAALDSGYGWNPDQNTPAPSGVGIYPSSLRDGERVTANDAYLEPARDRENLTIQGGSLVDRVLFDASGRNAVGVHYQRQGEWQSAECGEVILCAGAIHSPAILMRSGIGPSGDLRRLGIRVVHDAPVGQRLQDHPMLSISLEGSSLGPPGPGRGYNVVLRTSCGLEDDRECYMMVHPAYQNDRFSRSIGLFIFLLVCHSRGVLRLASADPLAMPEIDERMLSDERDLARMHEAVRIAMTLAGQQTLTNIVGRPRVGTNELTMTETGKWMSDAELLTNIADAKHISCTCPMGDPNDKGVVVNSRGEVVGVSRLRVADMSITPAVPRANTYLTAVMIGEHIVAMMSQR